MTQMILNHQTVTNLDKLIRFTLNGQEMVRRLVITAFKPEEISLAAPVGWKLANAQPGATFEIPVEDEPSIQYEVLSIEG